MKRTAGNFWLTVALGLAGLGLMFVPAEVLGPVRILVREALRPGQAALHAAHREGRTWILAWRNPDNHFDRLVNRDDDREALGLENRRLELQVAALNERVRLLSEQQGLTPIPTSPAPLFTPRLVEARVLGEETAMLWRARKWLSAGASSDVVESALVLDDARPLVDVGADGGLVAGDAAYAGRIVVGKIAEVGRYSSTLRLVTDPGFSGRARLARRTSRRLVFGAQGTIVGDGSDLCRLKHVADPVNVGDEVFTGGTDGLVPLPMYFGTVVRAELVPGANEWSVWVKPAASTERLESVLILRRAINPDRILAN